MVSNERAERILKLQCNTKTQLERFSVTHSFLTWQIKDDKLRITRPKCYTGSHHTTSYLGSEDGWQKIEVPREKKAVVSPNL